MGNKTYYIPRSYKFLLNYSKKSYNLDIELDLAFEL
jgi:hypothetical protein